MNVEKRIVTLDMNSAELEVAKQPTRRVRVIKCEFCGGATARVGRRDADGLKLAFCESCFAVSNGDVDGSELISEVELGDRMRKARSYTSCCTRWGD